MDGHHAGAPGTSGQAHGNLRPSLRPVWVSSPDAQTLKQLLPIALCLGMPKYGLPSWQPSEEHQSKRTLRSLFSILFF